MRVLVTGATGFVASAVIPALEAAGHVPVAAVRRADGLAVPARRIGDIGPKTDWTSALSDMDAVVHLAGVAHRMAGESDDVYERVNGAGTACLAECAAAASIRHLVFVSTIKVHGESTPYSGPPFRDTDNPSPEDAYARSKLAGERALLAVAERSGMAATVLRPPLVYGPGAPANFQALMRACDKALPLPLASVRNRRSLLAASNLAAAISACLGNQAAVGRVFPVCDGEDVSTPELIRRIAFALNRPARLLPCPLAVIRGAGALAGHGPTVRRLTDSLAVDGSAIRDALGWDPPLSLDAALAETAAAWRYEG